MSYIRNSNNVWLALKEHISFEQEEVWCLALNSECRLIEQKMIFRGTVDHCQIHPRDIFRFLLRSNASQFIIAHSHPSQNPIPSGKDIEFTNKLAVLSSLMEFKLVDHVILSHTRYFSFDDSALLKQTSFVESSIGTF